MKKIFVTRKIPKEPVTLLKEHFDVEYNDTDDILSKSQLLERIKDKDGILCLLTDNIDKEVLDAVKGKCKIIANYAVGYNNIDIKAATESGIIITNTPGVLDDATADLAWALLLSTARRIPEAERFVRDRKFDNWKATLLLGMDITGKTLGVVGAGRIGTNFAKKGKAFNMNILYTSSNPNENLEMVTGGKFVSKEELFKQSDFISLHIPLDARTHHYVSHKELQLMKDTAILINTSRGPIVDEKALVKALKENKIWGAGLDVFENEPLIEEELYNLDNVVLLPHIGSATIETRTNMGMMAARNIISVLNDGKPLNCVNKA